MDSKLLSFVIIVFCTNIKADTSTASSWKIASEQKAVSKYKENLLNPKILKFLEKCYDPKCCSIPENLTCYTFFEVLYQAHLPDISIEILNSTLHKYKTPVNGKEFCDTLANRLPSDSNVTIPSKIAFLDDLKEHCSSVCRLETASSLEFVVTEHCVVLSMLLNEVQKPLKSKDDLRNLILMKKEKLVPQPRNDIDTPKANLGGDPVKIDDTHQLNDQKIKSSNTIPSNVVLNNETKSNLTETKSKLVEVKPDISEKRPTQPINLPPLPIEKESMSKEQDRDIFSEHSLNATGDNEGGGLADNPSSNKNDGDDESMNDENNPIEDDVIDDGILPDKPDNMGSIETKLSHQHTSEMKMPATDPFVEDTGSNFFSYFLFGMFACIVLYVIYNNKTKILALIVEGRQSQGGRNGRRKHTAAYRKLDTNLEEAITSSTSGRGSQVIY